MELIYLRRNQRVAVPKNENRNQNRLRRFKNFKEPEPEPLGPEAVLVPKTGSLFHCSPFILGPFILGSFLTIVQLMIINEYGAIIP